MANPTKATLDPHSSLIGIFDAVHGTIDVRDAMANADSMIIKLLGSVAVQRLRNVKQLGFASQSYPSADHSRYAHALGTMHMMRKILERLFDRETLNPALFRALKKAYQDTFSGKQQKDREILMQHMLVAALLQDIGELPFGQATKLVYKPSAELRQQVEHSANIDVSNWNDKNIFTIGCIYNQSIVRIIETLNLPFLTFLITGFSGLSDEAKTTLMPLRHILDGVVDADRLDYVFRDAHHTVGGLGNPSAVIESLLYYDYIGPVLSDPAPVSNFLATRAHLYSTVYLAPANRFRTLLLVNFLQGVARREECSHEFFGMAGNGKLSIEDFLELDDVSITSRIMTFDGGSSKRRLDTRSKIALGILAGHNYDYQCFWLPPPQELGAKSAKKSKIPEDLFFDTFAGQERPLYPRGSVRIKAERFRYIHGLVPLENCGGSLNAIFKEHWSLLPMPGSILLYVPQKRIGDTWSEFQASLNENTIYDVLMEIDPLGPVDFPDDTRNEKGFIGPDLFISFAWGDIRTVKQIANALYRKHQRYYLYLTPYRGLGKSPASNSSDAVKQAQAVLMLVSENYISRYRESPDGNIAREIFELSRQVKENNLRVVVLSLDNFREIQDRLPWSQLGWNEAPFVGSPLRYATEHQIEDAIDQVIRIIDKN